MKIYLRRQIIAVITIISMLIPASAVFGLDKNYRQAGLIDNMSSKRLMKSCENVVLSDKGAEAESGKDAVIEYRLTDEFSFGYICYKDKCKYSRSCFERRREYKDVIITDNELYKG